MSRKMLLVKVALRGICVIAFLGYVLSIALFLRYMEKSVVEVAVIPVKPPPSAIVQAPVPPQSFGIPARLIIPGIKVDAAITSVGIATDGSMDIKKNPDETAWYNLGPRPGNVGSAVIAGHYGWDNGRGSVFNELHTLKAGDTFSVSDDKGASIPFVVRETRTYDPAADATTIFRSNDDKAHLNLITCEGVWDNAHQTYSRRLVVFGDKK